jgi:hypothetical protein
MKKNPTFKLCMCCGEIFNVDTGKYVNIPLSELPADIALDRLLIKNGVLKQNPEVKRKKKR